MAIADDYAAIAAAMKAKNEPAWPVLARFVAVDLDKVAQDPRFLVVEHKMKKLTTAEIDSISAWMMRGRSSGDDDAPEERAVSPEYAALRIKIDELADRMDRDEGAYRRERRRLVDAEISAQLRARGEVTAEVMELRAQADLAHKDYLLKEGGLRVEMRALHDEARNTPEGEVHSDDIYCRIVR